MKTKCLPVLLLWAFAGLSAFAQTAPDASSTVTIDSSAVNPLDGPFLGFGAEWDCYDYVRFKFDDTDFNVLRQRLKWMHTPLVRAIMVSGWCYRGSDTYDWDNPQMKMLMQQLDLCQELGISVILTDWGVNDTWLKVPDVTQVDDPKYAEIIGTYLDYLINQKKYTCIKYFVFTNEPLGHNKTLEQFTKGLANVAAELKKRGLNDLVRFAGPDESGLQTDLLKPTFDTLGAGLGAYDLHCYPNLRKTYATSEEAASSGFTQTFLSAAWKSVRAMDPDVTKPLIVGEAGFWSYPPEVDKMANAGTNGLAKDWVYGYIMSQYAIQAVNAGTWGVSAWMLDDSEHANFEWGMMGPKEQNFALKPWFYTWSLLSRCFPPGSTFAVAKSLPAGVQVLAARQPATDPKTPPGWSFCIVNTNDAETDFTLTVPEAADAKTAHYLYTKDAQAVDDNGFPKPADEFMAKWSAGVPVTCPPKSVIFYTPAAVADAP